MSELLSALEALSKIVALISASVVAVGLLIQYQLKVKEELRLRDLATLEMDVRISSVFSELVSIANGYGGWSEPQGQIIDEILKSVPQELKQQLILSDPRSIGKLVSGALIPKSVPLSQQLAASESLANLAIRYPFLLEPALVGLDVVAGFMLQAKNPYNRLCTHYKISRPLTEWGFVPGEPNYGYKGQDI